MGADERRIIRTSALKNVKNNRESEEDYSGDPPDHLDPCWFQPGTKLAPNKFVVIEVVPGQIECVMEAGVDTPAGIVIGPADRAGEGTARDILAADGTYLRGLESCLGHF
jgi:hypothetical protein